jgi:NADPH2 dehydrogenase
VVSISAGYDMPNYRKVASFKSPEQFQSYLAGEGIDLPFTHTILPAPESPLAQPFELYGKRLSNRFSILPMEGWDGTLDGHPSALTFRRWENFGLSGASLIWGCEAAAVRQDGRANPNQLLITEDTLDDFIHLRQGLVDSHRKVGGSEEGLLIGLQLTHSGRFSRPTGKPEPVLAYDHPFLNRRVGLPARSDRVILDDEVDQLIQDFIQAAVLARRAGFDFVDIKHCHGYLFHEFLSAVDRPGKYGGSFENRTRILRQVVQGIRSAAPGLEIGVRLSAFDLIPFKPGEGRVGEAEQWEQPYPYAFGGDGTGLGINLDEPVAFLKLLESLGIRLVCITGGSPYYNPHIQRPAYFPPSDGYLPPENPLAGVARQVQVAASLKAACPEMVVVGSAYSCLQEYLPHVAQAVIGNGKADFVGLGRMVLSYPQLPVDVLAGRALQRTRICRTFSDCTTAPRNGMVSGCYPLDEFYHQREECTRLEALKKAAIGKSLS